jgi:hypothetical protein
MLDQGIDSSRVQCIDGGDSVAWTQYRFDRMLRTDRLIEIVFSMIRRPSQTAEVEVIIAEKAAEWRSESPHSKLPHCPSGSYDDHS